MVAVCDVDDLHTAEFNRSFDGKLAMYRDYREMLEKEKPDLVAIGPRNTVRHKEYILACAAAGAHGYLEKPVAVDCAESGNAQP